MTDFNWREKAKSVLTSELAGAAATLGLQALRGAGITGTSGHWDYRHFGAPVPITVYDRNLFHR